MENYTEKEANKLFKVRSLDKYMEGHNGFIAGGCFKNIFTSKAFKDVDIFFKNEKDFLEALKMFSDSSEYSKSYENKNSVCFQCNKNFVKIDLVRSKYGSPLEIISLFDFTITKFSYYKKESEEGFTYTCVYINLFFEHLTTKKLVIDDKIPFPIGTFERSYRYMKYGYGLCRESKAKLIDSLQGQSTENLSKDLYFGFD